MPYQQLHTATTLGELATKYENGEFIADRLCSVTPIERKKAQFWKFTRADASRLTDSRMAPDGLPNRRTFTATSSTVEVEPFGLHDTIPVSDLEDPEPGIELEADTVEDLTSDLLMGHEKRVSDLLMTAANYASANKVTLTVPWTDRVSSDPIAEIQAGKRACAVTPNMGGCDEETFDALARHPDIISTLRGQGVSVTNGLASAAEIARYFGLDDIAVGRVKYNSANPTATASYDYLWPQGRFLLCKHVPAPRAREVVTARCYRHRSSGMTMNVFREVQGAPGTKGVLFVKVTMEEVVGQVAADTGYLISGAA